MERDGRPSIRDGWILEWQEGDRWRRHDPAAEHEWKEAAPLHELTHNLADDQHGPKFCWAFLLLVREFMGRATYDRLLDAFGNHRVKMS